VRYQIGDLVLDTGLRRVTRGDDVLHLGGLTFDLLLVLAESAPNFVSYDQLAESVWQGRPVTPETFAQRAKMLREALSDEASEPRYVELIRGQGYRLIPDVEMLAPGTASPEPGFPLRLVALVFVGVAILAYVGVTLLQNKVEPSVAVLPFADMSPERDQGFLADGIAEELLNELAGLDGLHVASRTSSFSFRDSKEDLKSIGEQLGVAAVLEGSIRKFEDDMRITVQLIEVDSGFRLWSESFDSELDDVFAVQEQIATATAGALGVTLGVGDVNAFRGAGTRNFAAYEAYLQGNYEQAIGLDRNYAAAWARRAVQIASDMWNRSPEDAHAIIERAYSYEAMAMKLDPESSYVNNRFATLMYARMEWQQSEVSFRKALSLRRDRLNLLSYANMLMRAGRIRAALSIHSEADVVERMPRPASRLRNFANIADGDFEAARSTAAKLRDQRRLEANILIALNDGSVEELRAALRATISSAYPTSALYTPLLEILDSPADALSLLEATLADDNTVWPDKYHDIGLLAAYFGDPKLSLEAFARETPYTTIRYTSLWFQVMAEARQLPEFRKLVTEANLVEYWRAYGWADACRPLGDDDFECS
jgi:TolB-like protein/DNA-binding winged helix-turn-helix (wHTH) protein